jgi:type I restriction enzyme R subunit
VSGIQTPGSPPAYTPVAVSDESTVVAQYVAEPNDDTGYQSEAALEKALVDQLQRQAYEYLPLTSDADLVANLRSQLERLNDVTLTDTEWQRFFTEKIAAAGDGIVEKTVRIQTDHVQVLTRDDGTAKNITLLDKRNIHRNRLQVVNQYESIGAKATRSDVTILVNGLPLVHVELKRRGVDIREAFNQIARYQRDSFWADSGLFGYVQLFVISNGTLTKYYSNTTRESHVGEVAKAAGRKGRRQTSHSFEFTSWWTDATNTRIGDLTGFTKTFFAKHTLLNLLTRYCVLDADKKLLVMRPYQVVATERILQRIETSSHAKRWGTVSAGGYVWHTTGSGKTLTSFKTAQLASGLAGVEKVLFVVDRKDLDYQTMREYDRFEKGAVDGTRNTNHLKERLGNPDSRILVTTIQKLARFIERNPQHPVYDQHVVIVFDECHRSQFGDMHTAITKAFRRYHLFGFTGTPIFADNAGTGGSPGLRTTEQAFGDRLHTYTIVDAIHDKNVLPFRIDYVNTVKVADGVVDKEVSAIDTERALLSPQRISRVVDYVLDHFDQKTRRAQHYRLGDRRVSGFNSLFAAASIDAAKRYYSTFEAEQRRREEADPRYQRLRIGIIYSYAANEEVDGGLLAEEDFETDTLDQGSRDFLEDAVADYNDMFATSFDTSADGFQGYHKDLSQRLKSRELDLVIVVNMFLTGFDATTLNTLWVDKNLRQHGLIQAFSRTNRILNSVKTYGTIVCFRDLEDATNDALALFGNKDAQGIVLMAPFAEYHAEYAAKVAELQARFEPGVEPLGEEAQKDFIALLGAILRLRNILVSFDEFAEQEILSARDLQDYQSVYLDLYRSFRQERAAEKEAIEDDLVFEIELIKQVEVNVDYVLMLVRRYLEEHGPGQDHEIRAQITRAVDASPSLRNKRDLIEQFVDSLTVGAEIDAEWEAFVAAKREAELATIIEEEQLKPAETRTFVDAAFRDGVLTETGTAVTRILPPTSRFAKSGNHTAKKRTVLDKLRTFFDRYSGLG